MRELSFWNRLRRKHARRATRGAAREATSGDDSWTQERKHAPRPRERIELQYRVGCLVDDALDNRRRVDLAIIFPSVVPAGDFNQSHDIIIIDGDSAAHKCFGKTKCWIEQYLALSRRTLHPHSDVGPSRIAIAKTYIIPVGPYDIEPPMVQFSSQQFFEQGHMIVLRLRLRSKNYRPRLLKTSANR